MSLLTNINSDAYYAELILPLQNAEDVESGKALLKCAMGQWFKKKCPSHFKAEIENELKTIYQLYPGRQLLEAAIQNEDLKIIDGERYFYSPSHNTISVGSSSKTFYTYNYDKVKNKIKLEPVINKVIPLVHELGHAANQWGKGQYSSKNLIHKLYHNEEEQRVVTGILYDKNAYKLLYQCSENIFRAALNINLRVTHCSICLDAHEQLNLNDWISIATVISELDPMGIQVNIEKKLKKHRDSINRILPLHAKKLERALLPLSHAIIEGNRAFMNLLVQEGARLDFSDDCGGVFGACVENPAFTKEVISLILKQENPLFFYPLLMRTFERRGNFDKVKPLLEGSRRLINYIIHTKSVQQKPPFLCEALKAENHTPNIALLFIEEGAELNCMDEEGNTPLLLLLKICLECKRTDAFDSLGPDELWKLFNYCVDSSKGNLEHVNHIGESALSLCLELEEGVALNKLIGNGVFLPSEQLSKINSICESMDPAIEPFSNLARQWMNGAASRLF